MEIVCLRCVGQVASIGSPILVALYEINRALREAYAQGIEAHTIGSHSLLVFEGVQFVEAVDELSGERERERDSLKEFQERSSSGGSRSGGSTGNRLGRVGGRTRFALEEIENKTLRK